LVKENDWISEGLELYDDYLELKNLQFLSKEISLPAFGKAKIRYRQKDQNCILNKNSD